MQDTAGLSASCTAATATRESAWPAKYWPASQVRAALAKMPRPWVFTNGVFDLLHRGHVQYLHEARLLGATLIVAVNSDASVRMLGKGPGRPLNPDVDRVWVLSGLEDVSLLTTFDEPTPLRLLDLIRPDVYVKGGDYDMRMLPEAKLMASWGGRSLSLNYREGCSTTALIGKATEKNAQEAPRRS
jgi:rfaE bifunctional protein nucleotidyltransferase chain/domain